jgi:hypothetical protein
MSTEWCTEITVFAKRGGTMSKRIWLDDDGKVISDGSACAMAHGIARRVEIADIRTYADLINACRPNEAVALGRLKPGLPAEVNIVTANELNGGTDPKTVARTKDFFIFEPGKAGLVLIDFDPKGMSDAVKQQFEQFGGLFGALCTILPALETVALVERASTSSGLRNAETGESFRHSGGKHIVIAVLDAADIPRFLSDLHARAWLNGLGWGICSAAGSFLERSIVDKSCGSPERLIFEGAPIIEPPLVQAAREAIAHDGTVLDTRQCAPLTEREQADLEKLVAAEELRLLPERQAARAAWSLHHIERLIGRGVPECEARREVDRWIDRRELTSGFELPFDDRTLAGITVADVLADPDRFIGETMADPVEGPPYGRGKAIIFRHPDRSLFINSFAHGGMAYELPKTSPKDAKRERWNVLPLKWRDPATIEPRHFLYGHYYARGFVSVTVADGGIGKSILKLSEALTLATGLPLLGVTPNERVRVLYWNGDDPYVEVERRISAICEHHGIDAKRFLDEGWLYVGTRDKQPLIIGELEHGRMVIHQDVIDDVCAFIRDKDIGFAAFDPLKACHRVPENDNTDMDAIADAFSIIAERTNAAVGLEHHTRKPAAGQGEVTSADARGAGAIINKVRLSRVGNPMTQTLAEQARVPEEERRRYFRIDMGKGNIVPPGKAVWFKIVSVPCANGQDSPIVVPWKFPGALDQITVDHMHRVRTMAAEGAYRKDTQSDDWIGRAVAEVVGLDADDDADRRQIKAVLKTWFANGVLDVQDRKDEHRKNRVFIVPGNWRDEPAPPSI